MIKSIQLVLDVNGELIDKNYSPIRSHANYKYVLQVVSPALPTSAVDATFSTYDSQIVNKSIRLRLAKDSNDNYYKGKDVVDNKRPYYESIMDYNVWEVELYGGILSIVQKVNASKIAVGVTISENINDPNALNYLGTFNIINDLPISANEGDYYICNSIGIDREFKYKDIAYWNGTKWTKGNTFRLTNPSMITYLTVEPSLLLVRDAIEPDLTADIVGAISELDGVTSLIQERLTELENLDMSELMNEISSKQDKLPTITPQDIGKALVVNSTGDGYEYAEASTGGGEGGIEIPVHNHDDRYYTETEINSLLTGKSNTSHNHDDKYYTETEVNTLLTNKVDTSTLTSHTSDNTIHVTSTDINSRISTAVSSLVNSAPATLDTLNELSSALGNDPNFATTVATQIGNKANSSDVYSKSEVDTKLTGKSNTSHIHDDRYYTESEVDTKLSEKSDNVHNHDDVYYTETEIDTKLETKSDVGHTHSYNDLSDLPTGGGSGSGAGWEYVTQLDTTATNISFIYAFDWSNYDYRAICTWETNAFDNSVPIMNYYFNTSNPISSRYTYFSEGSQFQNHGTGNDAPTGLSLTLISGMAGTQTFGYIDMEITHPNQFALSPYYHIIKGKGMIFTNDTTKAFISSTFTHMVFTGANVNRFAINNISDAGTTNHQHVKLYRRPKMI